jgi:large subunit ribosomal protein L9
MKVLLIKDVYKLGHAGDVRRVADGYGRNYLLPQSLAVLATPGAINQSGKIREEANKQREIVNKEMDAIAERIKDVTLAFAAKAGETGKMYGSITTQDIATLLQQKTGVEIKRQNIDMQPLRTLGEHKVHIRLTMDLIPDIKVVIYREGEANPTEPVAKAQAAVPAPVEPVAVEVAAAEPVEAAPIVEPTAAVIEPVIIEPAKVAPVAEEPTAAAVEPVAAEPAEVAPVAEEQQAPVEEAAPEEVAPEETQDTPEA